MDMEDSAKLGNNFKKREVKKMSQGDVMRAMGCSRSYISTLKMEKPILPLGQFRR